MVLCEKMGAQGAFSSFTTGTRDQGRVGHGARGRDPIVEWLKRAQPASETASKCLALTLSAGDGTELRRLAHCCAAIVLQ